MQLVQKDKRKEATKMRLKGKSYGEIMKALDIPSKGTLSYWFHNLALSDEAKSRLQKNMQLARDRGIFAYNENRTKDILIENKKIRLESQKEIRKLSQEDLLLIGTALYWAEGVNREASQGYQSISFTNSDPRMIGVFMRYLREVLKVADDKIKPGVIVYPNLDLEKTKDFWANLIKLPKENFWMTVAISRASKGKKPSNYLLYGTIHLRVNNRQLFYKIQGYISGLVTQLDINTKE